MLKSGKLSVEKNKKSVYNIESGPHIWIFIGATVFVRCTEAFFVWSMGEDTSAYEDISIYNETGSLQIKLKFTKWLFTVKLIHYRSN